MERGIDDVVWDVGLTWCGTWGWGGIDQVWDVRLGWWDMGLGWCGTWDWAGVGRRIRVVFTDGNTLVGNEDGTKSIFRVVFLKAILSIDTVLNLDDKFFLFYQLISSHTTPFKSILRTRFQKLFLKYKKEKLKQTQKKKEKKKKSKQHQTNNKLISPCVSFFHHTQEAFTSTDLFTKGFSASVDHCGGLTRLLVTQQR